MQTIGRRMIHASISYNTPSSDIKIIYDILKSSYPSQNVLSQMIVYYVQGMHADCMASVGVIVYSGACLFYNTLTYTYT